LGDSIRLASENSKQLFRFGGPLGRPRGR
jgi:hypothetical protein